MEEESASELFGLTAAWHEAGLVTPARLEALRHYRWYSGDPNAEHYRWALFRDFIAENRPLSEPQVEALYQLAKGEADHAMATSMVHTLLGLHECPRSVLAWAEAWGENSIREKLQRVMASRRPESLGES